MKSWQRVPQGLVLGLLFPAAVVGIASAFGFAWSLVLLLPVAVRTGALASAAAWVSAAVSVALPWAIGMVLGSNSLHRRPVRRDGVPQNPTRTGSALR